MTKELRENYEKLLRGELSDYRFEHCLNVSAEAVELARLYGGNAEKAELAGLLHDILKEAEPERQLYYIGLHREPDEYLLASKKLWHAHAAAAYCEHELGLADPELLNAIRFHSSGRRNMTLLDKIIYIADFTSAERDYDDVDVMRALSRKSLDDAALYALSYTVRSLAEKNAGIHPDTLFAYDDLVFFRNRQGGFD